MTTTSQASTTEGLEDLPIHNFTSDATEGLKDLPIHNFTNVAQLQKLVKEQSDQLITGESIQQYIVIGKVTKAALECIDKAYSAIGKHTRLTYFVDPRLLIIKLMPCEDHEQAHLGLFSQILLKIGRMGLDRNVRGMGGADFWNTQQSFRKQGDSCLRPDPPRTRDDWPTLVIEAGVSESLSRLRIDAQRWLVESSGDVKIVIIVSVQQQLKRVHIERWMHAVQPRPAIRWTPANTPVPTRVNEIDITYRATLPQGQRQVFQFGSRYYTIIGAPLIADFKAVFLRNPATAVEGDIIFSNMDLMWFAKGVFFG